VRLDIDPESRWPVDVLLEIEPLCSQPYDAEAWRRRILDRVAPGETVHTTAGTTEHGFPMAIVEAGTCIVALYSFVDHVAAAIARAGDRETLAARRDEILALLRGARPDWSGPDIVCLAQLWEVA
jgi:hypothetical protein